MSNTQQTNHQPGVAWIEIPVSNLDAGIAFYSAVTGHPLTREQMGPQETAVIEFTSGSDFNTGAHLYEGTPGVGGMTVHIGCAGRLEEAMARVTAAGGRVTSPAIEIPQGRFAYANDPDGNSIAVFERA